jgi:hypothetical protein
LLHGRVQIQDQLFNVWFWASCTHQQLGHTQVKCHTWPIKDTKIEISFYSYAIKVHRARTHATFSLSVHHYKCKIILNIHQFFYVHEYDHIQNFIQFTFMWDTQSSKHINNTFWTSLSNSKICSHPTNK